MLESSVSFWVGCGAWRAHSRRAGQPRAAARVGTRWPAAGPLGRPSAAVPFDFRLLRSRRSRNSCPSCVLHGACQIALPFSSRRHRPGPSLTTDTPARPLPFSSQDFSVRHLEVQAVPDSLVPLVASMYLPDSLKEA